MGAFFGEIALQDIFGDVVLVVRKGRVRYCRTAAQRAEAVGVLRLTVAGMLETAAV